MWGERERGSERERERERESARETGNTLEELEMLILFPLLL